MKKLWFSLYDNNPYNGDDPVFFDINNFKGISDLKQNAEVIYEELIEFLKHQTMETHFNVTMTSKKGSWKVRSLRVWGVEMYQYQQHFKNTMRLINNIDNVVNIGFNVLEANSRIHPHQGDTNAIIRCHLGLEIPDQTDECYIEVNGQRKSWHKGDIIAFTDAYTHYAANNTSQRRIIFLFDILKPEYLRKKNLICATVIMSFYMQQIGNLFPSLYHFPRKHFRYLLFPFVKILQIAILLRNRVKRWLY